MLRLPSLLEIGAMVRERRKAEHMSQKALAALADVSHISIIKIERGAGKVRAATLWDVLVALGLSA